MWSEKTRLPVRGRRPRTGSLVFEDHIEIRRMVCHSLSYYWKDTRLTVYIWQPFEARIIETWSPGLRIKYWYLRSVIKYWDPRSAVQTVTPQVSSSNTETPGLQIKYWNPRSKGQIPRPPVYISWAADLGSQYLNSRPWVSIFELQT